MTTDQDELLRLMWEWVDDGPLAPRVLDRVTFCDVTMFVCVHSHGLKWADYDKALDRFAVEMHAAGRLGGDMWHRAPRAR
jgi:hypothetical protein